MSTPPRPETTHQASSFQLDAAALKVLAHPLRSRLLGHLRTFGPATATDLAAALGTNSGATSYHLRELAAVGLVKDTEQGKGRRREWAPTTASHSWNDSDFRGDPETSAALAWLGHHYVHLFTQQMQAWAEAKPQWSDEWADQFGLSDTFVTVTPEQAAALRAELDDVLQRYRHVGEGDERAVRSQVHVHLAPLEPFEVPGGGREGPVSRLSDGGPEASPAPAPESGSSGAAS